MCDFFFILIVFTENNKIENEKENLYTSLV